MCASGNGLGEVRDSRKKFSGGERKAKGQVRLLRARGSVEFGLVASGFATQDLWLGDRKVGFHVIGGDRSLGEEQLGKLGEKEDEEEKKATKRNREYTDLWLYLGEREEQVACLALALALAMTDEARREAEM